MTRFCKIVALLSYELLELLLELLLDELLLELLELLDEVLDVPEEDSLSPLLP